MPFFFPEFTLETAKIDLFFFELLHGFVPKDIDVSLRDNSRIEIHDFSFIIQTPGLQITRVCDSGPDIRVHSLRDGLYLKLKVEALAAKPFHIVVTIQILEYLSIGWLWAAAHDEHPIIILPYEFLQSLSEP